jgi:hypothetical protein
MTMCCRTISLIFAIILCGCSLSDDEPSVSVFTASFDFSQAQDGWVADFVDLPAGDGDSAFFELQFAYTDLPVNLGTKKSIMLSGNNHSDDLFMFIKKKISGLIPNTTYTLVFEVELASNAPKGSVAAGGSPGESVFLKAGASKMEPAKILQSEHYVLNLDKGNRDTSGINAITLGDIAIPPTASGYTLISRSNAAPSSSPVFMAQTNSAGEIWLLVGTDSAFEGTTTVYYTRINIVFSTAY